jgi:hypothetical protein
MVSSLSSDVVQEQVFTTAGNELNTNFLSGARFNNDPE